MCGPKASPEWGPANCAREESRVSSCTFEHDGDGTSGQLTRPLGGRGGKSSETHPEGNFLDTE